MFLASMCDHAGNCRIFGPFKTELAARDWGLESQELGFMPQTTFSVKQLEEPVDLGFDPGL